MRTRNPVFTRDDTFSRVPTPSAGELQTMYAAPPATPAQMRRMTLDDVVVKTAGLLALLVASGAVAWVLDASAGVALGAAVVGFVLALVVIFKHRTSPALIAAYALVEGVFLGAISHAFNSALPGHRHPGGARHAVLLRRRARRLPRAVGTGDAAVHPHHPGRHDRSGRADAAEPGRVLVRRHAGYPRRRRHRHRLQHRRDRRRQLVLRPGLRRDRGRRSPTARRSASRGWPRSGSSSGWCGSTPRCFACWGTCGTSRVRRG